MCVRETYISHTQLIVCVTKLYVRDVCQRDVCERLCVTRWSRRRRVAEEEEEAADDGIQNQNKNPTQRCWEKATCAVESKHPTKYCPSESHTLSLLFQGAKVGSNHYLPNSGEQCFVGSFHAAPSLAASEDLLFHAPERGNDISSLLLLYVQ